MVYRIADLYVDIDSDWPGVHRRCSDYRCEEYPNVDFKVKVTEEEACRELPAGVTKETARKKMRLLAEFGAIYRKICERILDYDGFLMHGVLLEYDGKGYLFTANSGTGKTTHVKLWQEVFGESVRIINGDKPILRLVDGKVYGYGTPWCGKEGYNINDSVELCGICFIERGENNVIKKLDADDAVTRIFSQIMIVDSSNLGKQLELADALLEKVPTYLLKCNMEPEAAKVAYKGMSKA